MLLPSPVPSSITKTQVRWRLPSQLFWHLRTKYLHKGSSSSCSPDTRTGGSALRTKHPPTLEGQAGSGHTTGPHSPVPPHSSMKCPPSKRCVPVAPGEARTFPVSGQWVACVGGLMGLSSRTGGGLARASSSAVVTGIQNSRTQTVAQPSAKALLST